MFWYKLKDAPDDDDLERAKQTFWVVDMGGAWLVVAPQLILHGYIGATGVHLGKIQGDQIGQNFAIWAIFYGVGRIFFLEKVAQ